MNAHEMILSGYADWLLLLNGAPALVGSTENGGCTDCYLEALRLQLPFAPCDACYVGTQFEVIFYADFAKSIAAFCNARPWDGEVHHRRIALCGPEVVKVAFHDVELGAAGVRHAKMDLMMELWREANNVESCGGGETENATVARLLATSACF